MAGLYEITRARIPQIWTFVNSKLKFNGMNGVEGKFKNRTLCKSQRVRHPTKHRPGRSLTCEGGATRPSRPFHRWGAPVILWS